MVRSSLGASALAMGFVLLGAVAVSAQSPAGAPDRARRFSVGADLSASLAPADDEAFFNYTDYEQDGLRLARARLFGEWRVHPRLRAMAELRLESGRDIEFAAWLLRWQIRPDGSLNAEAGRIAPVFGGFPARAYGRDNPVMGTPLAYQYLTSLRPDAVPADVDDLLRMRGRGWQPFFPIGSAEPGPGLALVSIAEWSTGVAVRWRHDAIEVAAAVTEGAPSNPRTLDFAGGAQWSGRMSMSLPGGVTFGVSGARGRWLDREVLDLVSASGAGQTAVGVDVEYGRGRWLWRGEWVGTRHELPLGSPAGVLALDSHSGFAEVRWRPHPRWQIGGRAEYLRFSHLAGQRFADGPWDAPVERLEAALNYRVTRRLDVRAGWQHNWRAGGRVRERGVPVAGVLYWF